MRQKKHITKLLCKKIVRQVVGIVCVAALCLSPSAVSNARTDLIQNNQNGLIFASEENDGVITWGVCGYDESLNTTGKLTIEKSYNYMGSWINVIGIMYNGTNDARPGIFQGKTLPPAEVTSGVNGYRISHNTFADSKIEGSFLFYGGENPVIGDSVFENTQVEGRMLLRMSNGIIGENAFKNTVITDELLIEGSIDTIGAYAFSGTKANDLILPGQIAHIKSHAFANSCIKQLSLGNSLQTLGSKICEGCENLEKIVLPDHNYIQEAAPDAFPNKKGLTIVIPAGLTDLSVFSFENCKDVVFQTAENLSSESPVLQYLKENDLTYKKGEHGEIITPGRPSGPDPTNTPTATPTSTPTDAPTSTPASTPTDAPTSTPASTPTDAPTSTPASTPTATPTNTPTATPTTAPTNNPTAVPTTAPSGNPTAEPPTHTPSPTPAVQKHIIKKIIYRIQDRHTVTVIGATSKNIKKLQIPDTVTIKGRLYKVVRIEKGAFQKQKNLKTAMIGNYVRDVGNEAFASCKKLKKIQFGTGLKTLGKRALSQNTRLKTIIFKGKNLQKIGKNAFAGVPYNADIRAVRAKAKTYAGLINRSKK